MQQVNGWAKQLFGQAMLQQERLFEHLEFGVVGKELWMMYLMQRLSARVESARSQFNSKNTVSVLV